MARTDYADLIRRLRNQYVCNGSNNVQQAADAIEALLAERSALIERVRQMREDAQRARDAVLEEAAKVCETLGVDPHLNVYNGGPDWYRHAKDCAQAIRALKDK